MPISARLKASATKAKRKNESFSTSSVARGIGAGWSCGTRLRSAQVAFGFILAEVEHDDFVRRASTRNVKLNRLAHRAIFFLDILVVGNHIQRVLEMLLINFLEGYLNWTDMLGTLG